MDNVLCTAWMPGETAGLCLVIIWGGKLNSIIKANLLDCIHSGHVYNNLSALLCVKDKNLRLSLL